MAWLRYGPTWTDEQHRAFVATWDHFGVLLREWPEGHDPSFAEIGDVYAGLLKGHGKK